MPDCAALSAQGTAVVRAGLNSTTSQKALDCDTTTAWFPSAMSTTKADLGCTGWEPRISFGFISRQETASTAYSFGYWKT